MPFVDPLPLGEDEEVAQLAVFFTTTLGFPPNSVLTMQRRPQIARAFIALNKAVMTNEGRVTSEQKRLVALIASSAAGCRYCQAHTALAAERFGASKQRLNDIWSWQTSSAFTEAEKAAFELALAGAQQPSAIEEPLISRVRAFWDEGEIVELMGVIALFGFLNRWNDGMGTAIEDSARAAGERLSPKARWRSGKHG
jgi:uncharacterized peroxidase-related enzyme